MAVNRTAPRGKVIGVDVLPTLPIDGVTAIRGDFTSIYVQQNIRTVIQTTVTAPQKNTDFSDRLSHDGRQAYSNLKIANLTDLVIRTAVPTYLQRRPGVVDSDLVEDPEKQQQRLVDVVLSDMCEPSKG